MLGLWLGLRLEHFFDKVRVEVTVKVRGRASIRIRARVWGRIRVRDRGRVRVRATVGIVAMGEWQCRASLA